MCSDTFLVVHFPTEPLAGEGQLLHVDDVHVGSIVKQIANPTGKSYTSILLETRPFSLSRSSHTTLNAWCDLVVSGVLFSQLSLLHLSLFFKAIIFA